MCLSKAAIRVGKAAYVAASMATVIPRIYCRRVAMSHHCKQQYRSAGNAIVSARFTSDLLWGHFHCILFDAAPFCISFLMSHASARDLQGMQPVIVLFKTVAEIAVSWEILHHDNEQHGKK